MLSCLTDFNQLIGSAKGKLYILMYEMWTVSWSVWNSFSLFSEHYVL